MEGEGPSQLPGLKGRRASGKACPSAQTHPAHWHFSGQVTPWEFWGAVNKRGPGFWEVSGVSGHPPPAGSLEPWTTVIHASGVT